MTLPVVIAPKRFIDERGWFSETFHETRWPALGANARFVQDNQSLSKRALTLRGLHFQVPPTAQAKLVSVLRGRILDVAVDVRRGSPTFGKFVSVELSEANGWQFFSPAGFAHGFLTLEDNVTVNYKVSDFYAPKKEGGIRWDDLAIGIPWPARPADIIISAKDRQLPLLKDFDSPFPYDGTPLGALALPAAQ
jgi:dTDP-4-dehydrorhamnose 3,5-epimerase